MNTSKKSENKLTKGKFQKVNRNDLKDYGKKIIYIFVFCIFFNVLIEILSRHSIVAGISFFWAHPFLILYASLFLTAMYTLAFVFPKRYFVYLLITTFVLVLAITNCVLLFMRITPLSATDIELLPSVFDIMSVYMSVPAIIGIIVLLILVLAGLIILAVKMPRQKYRPYEGLICIVGTVALCLILSTVGEKSGLMQTRFANLPDAYRDNGFVYCFSKSLLDRGMNKPDNYSDESVEDILLAIENGKNKKVENTPNIIFLQIESFIDLRRMKNLTFSQNPQPVYSYLRDTYPGGLLTVPSVGAGTANTEFEILSGMSLAYFGAGEYPYKTVLKETTCESLATDLRQNGYKSGVIHNNKADFYDRNTVFANLGFDSFDSIEYMNDITYNPIGWAKDDILTQEIMKELSSTTQPDLIYTITVQDHGKYPSDEIENPHVKVEGFSDDEEERKNEFTYYVNQCHETDAFIGALVTALNNFEEPVVLVMYGDHIPNLQIQNEELSEGDIFQTEYIIWENRIQKKMDKISDRYEFWKENDKYPSNKYAYQLSAYVLDRLGMNNGVMTKFHQNYADKPGYDEKMETIQYDMLYGDKEAYAENGLFEPTLLHMGIDDISVNLVTCIGGSIYVFGDHFTKNSCVYLNQKSQDTVFVNDKMLRVSDKKAEDMDRISVAQTTEIGDILSQTDDYIYRDYE